MPPASATRPIRPSSASISRTRWPLPSPPMEGLQDIAPMVAKRWVTSAVRAPMRAAALAASQPAWPPPTTITSKRPSIGLSKKKAVVAMAGLPVKALIAALAGQRPMFHVKHELAAISTRLRRIVATPIYLPMQKSRKMTSKISSTSTRPVSRPSTVAAARSSSAISSSRPPVFAPSAKARSSAATVSSSARRCRARVTMPDFGRREKRTRITDQTGYQRLNSVSLPCRD